MHQTHVRACRVAALTRRRTLLEALRYGKALEQHDSELDTVFFFFFFTLVTGPRRSVSLS